MAEPQAPAGPNISPKDMGKMFPTLTSVMPGIRGMAVLKANRAELYMAAQTAVRMIIRVFLHMVKIAFIA
jgi:hypothetical protein